MRLRNIKGSREVIGASEFVVQEPEKLRGRWKDVFEGEGPLHVEIGMGKGQFISELARLHPKIHYIGIEKYSSVLLRAIQKQEENRYPNLKFIRMDAEMIAEVFAPGEVDRIYLNFSDPWPKDRHARRRLTSRQFFSRYDQILAAEGRVEFKTDNRALFDFSLEEVREAGWELGVCTYDLHHEEELCRGNVMTEYEERFSAMGNPIHKLTAFRIK